MLTDVAVGRTRAPGQGTVCRKLAVKPQPAANRRRCRPAAGYDLLLRRAQLDTPIDLECVFLGELAAVDVAHWLAPSLWNQHQLARITGLAKVAGNTLQPIARQLDVVIVRAPLVRVTSQRHGRRL